jgi:hypothetical protein
MTHLRTLARNIGTPLEWYREEDRFGRFTMVLGLVVGFALIGASFT